MPQPIVLMEEIVKSLDERILLITAELVERFAP
jgi:hypothetical protein